MAIRTTWLKPKTGQILVCLLCLQACTTLDSSRQARIATAEDLPPAVELTRTPFIPQTEHQCGPAALATVLQFHDVDADPDELTAYLYIPARKGSLQIEMVASARRFGMLPYPLAPLLSDLLAEIAAGNPVLVLQNLGYDWWPQWHYAVVVGYDSTNNELILRSGKTERWLTSFNTFEKTWSRADHWALVIVPAGTTPATAQISSYLKTAYAFEATGMNQYAMKSYRAATQRWSDQASAWLVLGNLAYQSGHRDEAVRALLTAASLSPDEIIAWNNLAYALHGIGCTAQALASLQCAYLISPDDENIRDSEQEIKNGTLQNDAKICPEIICD